MIAYKLTGSFYESVGCPPEVRLFYMPGLVLHAQPHEEHFRFPDGRLYFFRDRGYAWDFLQDHIRGQWGFYEHMMECEVPDDSEEYSRHIVVAKECKVIQEIYVP